MADNYEFPKISNGGSLACTTSFVDIPNLSFNVLNGGVYEFEAYGFWSASATTTTVMFALGGTFTASFYNYRISIATNTTGGSSSFVSGVKQPAGPSSAAVVAATNLPFIVSGLIVVNLAGTFTIAAKEGAIDATIVAGSRFHMRQVAP